MMKWHETQAANMCLRLAGAILVGLAMLAVSHLHAIAHSTSAHEASAVMMFLAAVTFWCGSVGSALVIVGPKLWDTVQVSQRWQKADRYKDQG
ncbi:hypothetical protein [Sphingopyxis yananensis]|uniref:hypothetical protein n=1 Tax=Sphingopyxis yananensis TaxID=2886687 RepID=UPI001D122050|nr:hypothetical protein [Sphingopyxis yananensis]MCC2601264.1 hypothetical protein [Sphingopyxis yananensis]